MLFQDVPGSTAFGLIFRTGDNVCREGNTGVNPEVPLDTLNLLAPCLCHCAFFLLTSPRPALLVQKQLGGLYVGGAQSASALTIIVSGCCWF